MAAERIFDEVDVQELLEQNAAPPFGARNAALILGDVYWGLTPLELCLVSTEDVEFYRVWVLPKHASFNGAAREVHTADHILPFFERYVDLRKDQNWGLSRKEPSTEKSILDTGLWGIRHMRFWFESEFCAEIFKAVARKFCECASL